jgi:formate hydrogenlyase subunit 3/multisubunit Na+/H+ antiporter MnhD subunit
LEDKKLKPLSKWIGIPFIVLWIIGGIGLWFLPWNSTGEAGWEWMNSILIRYAVKILGSIGALLGGIITLAWTFYADPKKENK